MEDKMGDMADCDAIYAESYEMFLEDMERDLERDLEDGVWTTKDGVRLTVGEMTDLHISNTIRVLIKGNKDFGLRWVAVLREEQARRSTENEMDGLAMGFDQYGGGNQ